MNVDFLIMIMAPILTQAVIIPIMAGLWHTQLQTVTVNLGF